MRAIYYEPGTVRQVLCVAWIISPDLYNFPVRQESYLQGQMRKLRLRDIKTPTQSHTAHKDQRWYVRPGQSGSTVLIFVLLLAIWWVLKTYYVTCKC